MPDRREDITAEVVVVGAGPTGLAAALALSMQGLDVVIAAPSFDPARAAIDARTTALLPPSLHLLENLGVWEFCAAESAPLAGVRIIDDRGGLVRSPEVRFDAVDIGLAKLGANVPNAALNAAFSARIDARSGPRWCATAAVTRIEPASSRVHLELAEGRQIDAGLVVAADGRHSIARTAAGIATNQWDYPQAAVVTTFRHSRPHDNISTELHRRDGPLTTVPLPGRTSSLVWVEDPREATRLAQLTELEFADQLEQRLQGMLGTIEVHHKRGVFTLAGLRAASMAQRRIALVGEAAHVIPPIGAQGLNLGLRDAAALTDCVADARAEGRDIGGDATLAAYARARGADVTSRSMMVDLLNRSLLTDFLPAQALRWSGLQLLAHSAPLRRLAMRGGAGAAGPLPRLMLSGPQAQASPQPVTGPGGT